MLIDPQLSLMYEEIRLKSHNSPNGYDIWDEEDLTNDKITHFFEHLSFKYLIFETFSEMGDVKIIVDKKPTNYGFEYRYENIINNIKFETIVSFIKCSNYSSQLENTIMYQSMNKQDVTELVKIKDYINQYPNKYIVSFQFVDENQLTKISGKMVNKSVTVFGAVYRNIRNALLRDEHKDQIIMLMCLVHKQEGKRIKLYDHMMNKIMQLKRLFIDMVSNNSYYILYYQFGN